MSAPASPLHQILAQLEAAKIYYTLDRTSENTVMVMAQVPGRHYEIEVFENGKVEVELYKSDGQIGGRKIVDDLLKDFLG